MADTETADHVDAYGYNFSAWVRGGGPCACWWYDVTLHAGHCCFLGSHAEGPDYCHAKPDGIDEAWKRIEAVKRGEPVSVRAAASPTEETRHG